MLKKTILPLAKFKPAKILIGSVFVLVKFTDEQIIHTVCESKKLEYCSQTRLMIAIYIQLAVLLDVFYIFLEVLFDICGY